MRSFVSLCTALILTALSVVGARAAGPWDLVWRSETASERTSVVGQARTMLGGDGAEISATATANAAGGKTRYDYRTPRREWSLIDDGQSLIELDPRHRTARIHERPRLVTDRSLAERNYVAKEIGLVQIAGRPATAIVVTPKAGGAAVLRLWLDKKTGFALKRERHNVDGKLVSSTEYIEVSFGAPVDKGLFTIPSGYETSQRRPPREELDLQQLSSRVGFSVRPPDYLPPGYVQSGTYQARWDRHHERTAELHYTDGIRMLSVFERERGDERIESPARGRPERSEGRRGGEFRGRGRDQDSPGGRGRGEGRRPGTSGQRHGFGPPSGDMSTVDRGYEKAVRYHGPALVVIVVGDLVEEDLTRIARSVAQD